MAEMGKKNRHNADALWRLCWISFSTLQVFLAEEVVDGLDGIEGGDGDLDEEGDPVGHGAVPESGELLRLEGERSFRLFTDESGFGVDVVSEVEIASAVVLGAAH